MQQLPPPEALAVVAARLGAQAAATAHALLQPALAQGLPLEVGKIHHHLVKLVVVSSS